jgi:hypothetical protein
VLGAIIDDYREVTRLVVEDPTRPARPLADAYVLEWSSRKLIGQANAEELRDLGKQKEVAPPSYLDACPDLAPKESSACLPLKDEKKAAPGDEAGEPSSSKKN